MYASVGISRVETYPLLELVESRRLDSWYKRRVKNNEWLSPEITWENSYSISEAGFKDSYFS